MFTLFFMTVALMFLSNYFDQASRGFTEDSGSQKFNIFMFFIFAGAAFLAYEWFNVPIGDLLSHG